MSLATAQHPNTNKQNQLPSTQHLSPSAVVAHNGFFQIGKIKNKDKKIHEGSKDDVNRERLNG